MSTAKSARRKSFAFFGNRPGFMSEDPDNTPQAWASKPRPKSAMFGSVTAVPDLTLTNTRTRTLTKSSSVGLKTKGMFGSLKGAKDRNGEPRSPVVGSSASSSIGDELSYSTTEGYAARYRVQPVSTVIMHRGELVTSGGLLRKKKEYLVLTSRELLRYKSENKANDAFGMGPGGPRHPGNRSSSIASISELHDHTLVASMDQVVAVYHPGGDQDSNSCSIQLDYFDSMGSPSSTVLMANTMPEAEKWVKKLRQVASSAREAVGPLSYPQVVIDHIVGKLDAEKDYSPSHFQIFRAVQRSAKPGNKSSSIEDLQKMYSTISYLVIGIHKIHLIPVNMPVTKTANSLPVLASSSYAIMNLSKMWISRSDDGFSLSFRSPCRQSHKITLASTDSEFILQSIRQAAEYLRPMWQIPPFVMDIPESMRDDPLPEIPPTPGDDLSGFDRTLAAYCTAYNLDASNIVYGIDNNAEDAPQFILYPPARSRRRQYTDLELLAILRTLRWNETICSISFARIALDPLIGIVDPYGQEYEPRYLKGGRPLNLKVAQDNKSLLVYELRALALYNTKLRRMDFSECISTGKDPTTQTGTQGDKACAIIEAIMPLCRRGLTNVDWFVFTGVELSEADLDWMIDAAASRLAHFRGFELSRCGLTERMLSLFLNALTTHENTLECLDLSRNPNRMHSPSINNLMCYFPYLRKLNLSRLLRISGEEAALTAETLLRWRLEELDLSETRLNAESVDAIATYLASPQSSALRHLVLSQCGLNGKDAAVLMHSMQRVPGRARDLHLYIGQNPLGQYTSDLTECIEKNITPSHLTMRMVDYPREELFQDVIRALTVNTTLKFLDISKTSLPYEAGELTCTLLGNMFAQNSTLVELDVSGEQAVLESASLGKGLVKPLARLAENKTLEILRIELQALGTPGAMELASLLTQNSTLKELHCEMNDIHLSGFSALVNAMATNHTLLHLPAMDKDRSEHVRILKEKLFQASQTNLAGGGEGGGGVFEGVKKEAEKVVHRKLPSSFRRASKSKKNVAFQESMGNVYEQAEQNLVLLEEKWESEVVRLQGYLRRNEMEMVARREAARSRYVAKRRVSGQGVGN